MKITKTVSIGSNTVTIEAEGYDAVEKVLNAEHTLRTGRDEDRWAAEIKVDHDGRWTIYVKDERAAHQLLSAMAVARLGLGRKFPVVLTGGEVEAKHIKVSDLKTTDYCSPSDER